MYKKGIAIIIIAFGMSFCSDPVRKFTGFTQSEIEFMLSGEGYKDWRLVRREVNDAEVSLEGCFQENYLVFVSGNALVYLYNPENCDSLSFCDLNPNFCKADTAYCNANPDECEGIPNYQLYLGTWTAKDPQFTGGDTDTLLIEVLNKEYKAFIESITSEKLILQYKDISRSTGSEIREIYQYQYPDPEE